MRLMSRMNPVGGVTDFWEEFRRPNPYRWPVLAASLVMTGTLLAWVTQEDYFVPPAPPQVTYITTFAEGRTDEEIRRSNIENQRRKDQMAAELAAREERRKELYRALGRATGIDVDRMEAEAKAEEAREAAALKARLEQDAAARGERRQTDPAPAD